MCINVKKTGGFVSRLYTFLPRARYGERELRHGEAHTERAGQHTGTPGVGVVRSTGIGGGQRKNGRGREREDRGERVYRFFLSPSGETTAPGRRTGRRFGAWHRNGRCKSPRRAAPLHHTFLRCITRNAATGLSRDPWHTRRIPFASFNCFQSPAAAASATVPRNTVFLC